MPNLLKNGLREARKLKNFKKVISARYLFEDGTTGMIGEKGSHTIVGVVVREKTATEDGLAVALRFFCIERKPLLAK